MESIGVYLLFVAAVAAGWLLGRISARDRAGPSREAGEMSQDYFVGLNYLLNDEPDEAIDTFVKALEINSDTVETHLAIGVLLRRRGKVDKAIRIHQGLLARPGLEKEFADAARLQLAVDYITAGLLDRAERLLKEVLSENSPARWNALKHLITVYQTEKDWERAADCATMLLSGPAHRKNAELRTAAAHFCCELAERHFAQNRNQQARDRIRRALSVDRRNVRASLLLARFEKEQGNSRAAIKELIRVRAGNPEFTDQILQLLGECYRQANRESEYEKLLRELLEREPGFGVATALAELVRSREGDEAAAKVLDDCFVARPSLAGLREVLRARPSVADADGSGRLRRAIDSLALGQPGYRCDNCGYRARNMYWLCPACQKWERIKPAAGKTTDDGPAAGPEAAARPAR